MILFYIVATFVLILSLVAFGVCYRRRNLALKTARHSQLPIRTAWPFPARRAANHMNLATIFGLASFVVLYLLSLN